MTEMKIAGMEGGCACGKVRYRLKADPMVTHCCHCTWCQRETGSAFVINALIEMSEVELLGSPPVSIETPSHSGRGQIIARCPDCHVAVWSHYSSAGSKAAFIRAGTLDDTGRVSPDVHIYTASKQPWIILKDGKPSFEDFYPNPGQVWPAASLERWKEMLKARPE